MNQIAGMPRQGAETPMTRAVSSWSEQAGREQVGEVLAAWSVAPGALLLLGWQEMAPPAEGMAQLERRRTDRGPFRCLSWPRADGGHAFIVAVRLPSETDPQPGQLLALHGTERLPLLARLPAMFAEAPAFAEIAAVLAGPRGGAAARFLCDTVPLAEVGCHPALGDMLVAFLSRVSVEDGCIELMGAVPEGCAFLQGWGRPLPGSSAGRGDVVLVGEQVSRHVAQGAVFDRPDIIAPSAGSLLVLPPEAAAGLPGLTRIFLLTDGGVRHRQLVERRLLDGDASKSHLRAVLGSLRGPSGMADCLRTSLKPRFEGRDTLQGGSRPVRVGIDLAVDAGGGCYLTGWLFDPADLVAAVHLHGGALLSAGVRLDRDWTRVARMDVTDAFAAEPLPTRPRCHDHGFAAFAPQGGVTGAARGAPPHLAVAFRDGEVAFLPLALRDGADAAVREGMLASVDLHKPSGLAIVERQLGPAFRALTAARPTAEVCFTVAGRPDARHAVVVPLPGEPALPRMTLAGLLNDPLAEDETMVVVCGGAWGAAKLDELRRSLAYYGLAAVVLRVPGLVDAAEALAAAADATRAVDFLLLAPGTVGTAPGWRSALRAARTAEGRVTYACPTLLYEDWSIRWAGDTALETFEAAPYVGVRHGLAGLPARAVGTLATARSVTQGNLSCCLVPRAALALIADGGVWTTSFGQAASFLSRLAAAGVGCLWLPAVQVYAVDDAPEPAGQPGVGRLVDGWRLREALREASSLSDTTRTGGHRQEPACVS